MFAFKLSVMVAKLFQTAVFRNVQANNSNIRQLHLTSSALSTSTGRKRFYKKVGIVQSNNEFEITLDNKKVKTPAGQIFRVSSEPLALAVANEWDAQSDKILVSSMHLTSLCNTILDNPNKLLKYDIINHMLTFLDNDTLLCREENEALAEEQRQRWDPVIKWFCERYGVNVEPSSSILGPVISENTRAELFKHFHSYNFWALSGIMYSVETVKSLIVALACIDRLLGVEEGVTLTTLETEFQTRHWGRVEWAHDVDICELQSRFSAAVLFVHLVTSSTGLERKVKQ